MKKNIMKTFQGNRRRLRRNRTASDDERWEAVVRRDPKADGEFYYSVKTTGVYCRPSCSARLPRRENVQFHTTCDAAEKAGFRPCKRCQPNGPALDEQYAATVAKACRIIKTANQALKLEVLAKSVGMSPFHFHRVFTRMVGLTPKAYANAHREECVRKTLRRRGTVTEAIYEAGYNSNSRFYEKSSEMLGMPPNRFRTGGSGAAIRFAIGECSLGSILVASSEKGVCAIFLGDDPNELAKNLQDQFPKANLIGGDASFERLISQVVGLVERPQVGCALPLDVRGTAFQQKVWQALREIPAGRTASYAEIANRIGRPKAVRAVGQACGANALAVAIPCHRVVRTDGSLSGYRWGVKRKRALLEKERRKRHCSSGSRQSHPDELLTQPTRDYFRRPRVGQSVY
jgi:AraC family transcriptional regulator of adaptative response/methylated-DNA-[protein]-cysteine methyltransferase